MSEIPNAGTLEKCIFRAFAILAFAPLAGAAHADNICTILVDAATGEVVTREGQCDRPVPPASTFKVAIALMGYDAGFLKNETVPKLPFKEGYADWIKAWRD